ncbi:MAG: DUF4331 family protein [Saprospiraceae bacterium]|nr:DUF4331 family protein [Saprospiraceae bacterium]
MKKVKYLFTVMVAGMASFILMSADHIDAPSVTGAATDIADFYVFQSEENSSNMVFVATLQGLLSPSSTSGANFSEDVLIEFNIDNDGDNIEDLVIQAIPRDGKMYAFGPYAPSQQGLRSMIDDSQDMIEADITAYGENAIVSNSGGKKLFAGPRDDPFFFDLGAYTDILAGNAPGFSDPGADTFAGTNVLSIVIEVPKSTLGNSESINTWVESKSKQ